MKQLYFIQSGESLNEVLPVNKFSDITLRITAFRTSVNSQGAPVQKVVLQEIQGVGHDLRIERYLLGLQQCHSKCSDASIVRGPKEDQRMRRPLHRLAQQKYVLVTAQRWSVRAAKKRKKRNRLTWNSNSRGLPHFSHAGTIFGNDSADTHTGSPPLLYRKICSG